MTYALPENITGLDGLMSYSASVTGGLFYTLVPVSLWLVVFIYLKQKAYFSSDAAMTASYITVACTFFLFLLGGISSTILFWTVAALFMSAIWSYWWKSKE